MKNYSSFTLEEREYMKNWRRDQFTYLVGQGMSKEEAYATVGKMIERDSKNSTSKKEEKTMLTLAQAQQDLMITMKEADYSTVQFDRKLVGKEEIKHFMAKSSSKFAYEIESIPTYGGVCIFVTSYTMEEVTAQ